MSGVEAKLLEDRPLTAGDRMVLQVSRWDSLKDPIGVIEGFLTAAVVGYVVKVRPALTAQAFGTTAQSAGRPRTLAPVLAAFGVAALLTGGVVAWFASAHPDGLEWSIAGVTGSAYVRIRPTTGA